ncbi:MAG: hypothetical protein ACREQL_04575 [Candidatus Binatia bacterium]
MSWKAWALGIAIGLLGCPTPGLAASPADETADGAPVGADTAAVASNDTPSKWEFVAEPYAWISGNYGSATVKGNTVQISVTPGDVLNLMLDGNAFGGMGYFSLAYDRYSVFIDSAGGYAEVAVGETIPTQLCTLTVGATDEIRYVINDFAVGYRLGQWSLPNRRRPLTLGVYAGTRYMHFGNKTSVSVGVVRGAQKAGNVDETFNWADPMIGVRWSVPLHDAITLDFRGDIGGSTPRAARRCRADDTAWPDLPPRARRWG